MPEDKVSTLTVILVYTIPSTDDDKATLSTNDDGKGKELVTKDKGKEKIASPDDVDLEEEIVILNWDLFDLSAEKMDILGEVWKKRARQQKL